MAVAHVQTVKTVDNTGGASITTGNIVIGGTGTNLLICAVLEYAVLGAGSHLPVPTSAKLDNVTAGAQDATSEAQDASNESMRVTFYSWPSVSAATHSVTIAYPASVPSNTLYFLVEVSGALTTAAVDGTGAGTSGSSTAVATGNATSTNSDDFWIAACTSIVANPAHFTKGAAWTSITGSETNSASNLCGAVEVLANPGATTENGTFTTDNGPWQATVIAYKAAAGAADTLMAQIAL